MYFSKKDDDLLSIKIDGKANTMARSDSNDIVVIFNLEKFNIDYFLFFFNKLSSSFLTSS